MTALSAAAPVIPVPILAAIITRVRRDGGRGNHSRNSGRGCGSHCLSLVTCPTSSRMGFVTWRANDKFCHILLQKCKSWSDTNRLHCQCFAWKGIFSLYTVVLSHVSCKNLWKKIIIITLNWGWITWASFACRALRKSSIPKPPLPSTPLEKQMLEMEKILGLCKRFFHFWNKVHPYPATSWST